MNFSAYIFLVLAINQMWIVQVDALIGAALIGGHALAGLLGIGGSSEEKKNNPPRRISMSPSCKPKSEYPIRHHVLKLCRFCRSGHNLGIRPVRVGFDSQTNQVMYKLEDDNDNQIPGADSKRQPCAPPRNPRDPMPNAIPNLIPKPCQSQQPMPNAIPNLIPKPCQSQQPMSNAIPPASPNAIPAKQCQCSCKSKN